MAEIGSRLTLNHLQNELALLTEFLNTEDPMDVCQLVPFDRGDGPELTVVAHREVIGRIAEITRLYTMLPHLLLVETSPVVGVSNKPAG